MPGIALDIPDAVRHNLEWGGGGAGNYSMIRAVEISPGVVVAEKDHFIQPG